MSNPLYHRGAWTADSLSGKIFYNGDVVIDDSVTFSKSLVSPSGSFTYYKVFAYKGDVAAETTAPNLTPTKWVHTGDVFETT